MAPELCMKWPLGLLSLTSVAPLFTHFTLGTFCSLCLEFSPPDSHTTLTSFRSLLSLSPYSASNVPSPGSPFPLCCHIFPHALLSHLIYGLFVSCLFHPTIWKLWEGKDLSYFVHCGCSNTQDIAWHIIGDC